MEIEHFEKCTKAPFSPKQSNEIHSVLAFLLWHIIQHPVVDWGLCIWDTCRNFTFFSNWKLTRKYGSKMTVTYFGEKVGSIRLHLQEKLWNIILEVRFKAFSKFVSIWGTYTYMHSDIETLSIVTTSVAYRSCHSYVPKTIYSKNVITAKTFYHPYKWSYSKVGVNPFTLATKCLHTNQLIR